MEVLVLVAMEASPSMDEYGWNTFWFLAEPAHAVESTVSAIRSVFHDVGGLCIMGSGSCLQKLMRGGFAASVHLGYPAPRKSMWSGIPDGDRYRRDCREKIILTRDMGQRRVRAGEL